MERYDKQWAMGNEQWADESPRHKANSTQPKLIGEIIEEMRLGRIGIFASFPEPPSKEGREKEGRPQDKLESTTLNG